MAEQKQPGYQILLAWKKNTDKEGIHIGRMAWMLPRPRRELQILSHENLVKGLKKSPVYMVIGHGAKNQFRDLHLLDAYLENIVKMIGPCATLLCFGDSSDVTKPDVGFATYALMCDLPRMTDCVVIQASMAKEYPVPPHATHVYWHDDFMNSEGKNVWGGIDEKTQLPVSNTKVWYDLVTKHGVEITGAFVLGGGLITLDEVKLLRQLNIHCTYCALERKYLGDGKTEVNYETATEDERYGPVHKEFVPDGIDKLINKQ